MGHLRDDAHDAAVSPESRPSRAHRVTGMDGLRGSAAVAVLVVHVVEYARGGDELGHLAPLVALLINALSVFFAMSGFLLYLPHVLAIRDGAPRPNTRRYFENRALRIAPANAAIFLLALAAGAILVRNSGVSPSVSDQLGTVGRISNPGALIANLTMLQTLFPQTILTGLGSSWSLTTEVTFYLCLPALGGLAAVCARRFGFVFGTLIPPILLILVGIAGKIVLVVSSQANSSSESFHQDWGPTWRAVATHSLIVQGDRIGYGMVAAVVLVYLLRDQSDLATSIRFRAVCVAGIVVLPFCLHPFGAAEIAFAMASALLLLLVALPTRTGKRNVLSWFFDSPIMRGLGAISYSFYLWHIPVILFLLQHGLMVAGGVTSLAVNIGIVALITTVLAATTYWLVERPALRLRRRPVSVRLVPGDSAGRSPLSGLDTKSA